MSSDSQEPGVIVYRQSSPNYDPISDLTFYPVNHIQLRDLLGRVLTQLDAMGLPDRAHKAARSLLTQEVWRWWSEVCDNATTSGEGCIAPIVMTRSSWPADEPPSTEPASNRWGWASEQAWLDSRKAGSVERTSATGV